MPRIYRKHLTAKRKWPTDPELRAAFAKKVNKQNNDRQYQELRDEIFGAYGRQCICCGETEPAFFCIDHISGGGRQERIRAGFGVRLWRLLKKGGFPPGYQVLCANCNQARRGGKKCPHQIKNFLGAAETREQLFRDLANVDRADENIIAEGKGKY